MGNQQCLKNDDSKPRQVLRKPTQNEDFTLSIQTVQKTNEIWKQLGVLPIEESFMRDNQIGSYLMEQEQIDYFQRAEVWQKAIQSNKDRNAKEDSKQSSDCDTCSSRDSEEKYNDQFPHCQTELDKQLIASYIKDQKAFKQLVRDGAPLQRVRWSSWQILVNTNKIEKILQHNILDVSQWNVKQETIISINKDVERTTTQHQIYFSKESQGYEQLNYVLVKLAKTFKDIQYVQGMNFIVGFVLLISTDKNSTYQFMVRLMMNKKFLMYYMFAEKMPLLKFLEYSFEQFLKTYSQDIYNQIYVRLKIPPILWLTKIFITLFLYSFPIKQCIKFWDFILSSNIFQMISILCAFLKVNQPIISEFTDQGDFMIWFDTQKNQKDITPDMQKQLDLNTKLMLEQARKLYVTDKFIQKCAHDYPYKDEQEFATMLFQYPRNVCEFIAMKLPTIIQRA